MPLGMGPMGWFMWPYIAQWMQYWYPRCDLPYFGYPGYGIPYRYPQLSKEDEISMLQNQAKVLEQELDRINGRLSELQKTE